MAVEKDVSLGEYLRHERERRGVTIEQVASATKIGIRTLYSLEADHYADLPAKPFIRGFVISYCRFIGLDAKDILSRFDDYMTQKVTERPNRDGGHSGYAFEKRDGEQQSRTILMIAIFGFIFVGGLAMLFLKPSLHQHRSSHLDKLRAAHSNPSAEGNQSPVPVSQNQGVAIPLAAISPVPSVLPSGSVAPGNSSTTPEKSEGKPEAKATGVVTSDSADNSNPKEAGEDPADPLDSGLSLSADAIRHKVVFKILADVWVRYQVDARPARKFIVRKGKILILRAKEKVQFQASNSNSVTYKYNTHAPKTLSQDQYGARKQGTMTFFFPAELTEKIEKPFNDEKPLPETPDPDVDPSGQEKNSDL